MTAPQVPTVAEKMLGDLEKINKALSELQIKGLPMSFIPLVKTLICINHKASDMFLGMDVSE